jgi:Protein of unknown function (DUF3604)
MPQHRHDRIIPLSRLSSYPGSDFLDMVLWLPPAEERRRRLWLLCPRGKPTVAIDDAVYEPLEAFEGANRWIDYGVVELPELPNGFSQLRVRGLAVEDCADSHLLIAKDEEFSPAGLSLEAAEEQLWGLARRNAGRTTISPDRVEVGSAVEFTVRYEAGKQGLPPGALLRFAVPLAFALPQTDDSESPGYTRPGNCEASIVIAGISHSIEAHEKTDVFCSLPDGLGAGKSVELLYSTDWSYIFSSRGVFKEADRCCWYVKQPPLGAAVAVSAAHSFLSLLEENVHAVDFLPGRAERLHLFLPGRRFANEKLLLRGVWTDRFRNVAPRGPLPIEYELSLVSTGGEIELGRPESGFTAEHRFEVPLPDLAPGVYRAVARCADGVEIARSNPLEIVEASTGAARIYWGEIHCHSEQSDGLGDFAGMYSFARDEGCMDFAAAADHACYFTDNQWQWMQDVTNSFNQRDRFVTLVGYEWAGAQVHRNIYTSRERLQLFRGMYPPTRNLDAVYPQLTGDEQVVAGPHAPLAHGIKWEHHDPEVERFVEIYSMWGSSENWEEPLLPVRARDCLAEGSPRAGLTSVNQLLATGARLGFTGGGDCHEARPGFTCEDPDRQGEVSHNFAKNLVYRCGMTAALLPELDRGSLLGALRQRRTYATTGARILLDFSVGGLGMGASGAVDKAECRATVHAPAPIARVEIIKDGQVVYGEEPEGLDAEIAWTDPVERTCEHYYYLRVIQHDGQQAWSSPVWVSPGE